jgi:pilus assembly protein Flp/PilA
MLHCLSVLAKLRGDQQAVTMLEYGLIAALIAVACIAAVTGLGSSLVASFTGVGGSV